MDKFKSRMIRLFLNHPLDYKTYLSMYDNPRYALRVISNLIPTDTGIEFEIGTPLVNHIRTIKRNGHFPRIVLENSEEVTFRLRKDHFLRDLKELQDFYNFLRKGYNSNNRLDNSGIHIHTNLIKGSLRNDEVIRLREHATTAVERIANYFNYTGDYNNRSFNTYKGYCVIYRFEYGTLEYRCIKMTWDFSELLKHIIYCHMCTKEFYKFTKHHRESILNRGISIAGRSLN